MVENKFPKTPKKSAGFREFSPYFEGGLTADMPATLYHFEGADAAVPFTLAAVAESGVE